jgi:anthranilate phosphoribosyltransferase
MAVILSGAATPGQIGAFLMGLRLKGETADEVVGLVEAMRGACVRIEPRRAIVVDLCGTGGDGRGTFNISTAASFVVAGAGVAVAKHGNRSASSLCGSADVLEALGVPIDLPAERTRAAIEEVGMGFLFAPLYHPAMKHVGAVRRELRIRTVFNLLGPLANPAGASWQLLGVPGPEARALLAGALRALGTRRAWVAHSRDGLDELSVSAPTDITAVRDGAEESIVVRPEDCGLPPSPAGALAGGDARRNAEIVAGILDGERGPPRDAVVLNAAAALVVAGAASDLREGAVRAAESIDSGAARTILAGLRRFR